MALVMHPSSPAPTCTLSDAVVDGLGLLSSACSGGTRPDLARAKPSWTIRLSRLMLRRYERNLSGGISSCGYPMRVVKLGQLCEYTTYMIDGSHYPPLGARKNIQQVSKPYIIQQVSKPYII